MRMKWFTLMGSLVLLVILSASISVYAEGEGTWTAKASMAEKRTLFQVAVLNGKIYAIGGGNGSSILKAIEEFDPTKNTWIAKTPMANKRASHQAVAINGKILVMGGYDGSNYLDSVEEYDPATDKWTAKAPMINKRSNFQVAVLDGKIYVLGGDYSGNSPMNAVEVYDPSTNKWTAKAPMSVKRFYHQAAVINGKIYAIGGSNEISPVDSVEMYDPNKDTWTNCAAMNAKREIHQVTVINGEIYAIGGVNTSNSLNSAEVYNPESNKWTMKTSMANMRAAHQIAVIDDKIYALGGNGQNGYLASVEKYDPLSDKWTVNASMLHERSNFHAVALNGKIYAIGGTIGTSNLNYVEEFTPAELLSSPSNLSAVAGNVKVDLTWVPAPGAAGYNVKRATTSGGPYTTIASNITTTSYADTTVINGTTYYYVVTALGASGESTNSNEVSAAPLPAPPAAPSNLTASPGNSRVSLAWTAVPGAGGYNVKRAATSGGPYTIIAENVTAPSYSDMTVVNGTTYYYIVTAIAEGLESPPSNEASAMPQNSGVSLTFQSADTANIGDIITVDVVINNAVNICAEDFKFDFDPNLLEYMGSTAAEGMRIYKETYVAGTVNTYRDVLSCLGKDNAANGSKVLLHLKFKAKQAGQARIFIVSGRIADNATLETDISVENCGEKVIVIGGIKDVNHSGEFTLLDLGIDAWYYGIPASETDTEKYDADLNLNGLIDDVDLANIVAEILLNANYPANL